MDSRNVHQEELMSSMSGLFTSGKYSDLTIICGADEYKVHKAIVCPRCEFFSKACDGPFSEAQSGIIKLEEDDSIAVRLMLHYFYNLDYPHVPPPPDSDPERAHSPLPVSFDFGRPPPSQGGGERLVTPQDSANAFPAPFEDDPWKISNRHRGKGKLPLTFNSSHDVETIFRPPNLTVHARVYALAEKYGISSLKTLALHKFEREAKAHYQTHDFLEAVEEVYTSTVDHDRGMRDVVLSVITDHADNLLGHPRFQEVIKGSDLSFDLLMKMWKPGSEFTGPRQPHKPYFG